MSDDLNPPMGRSLFVPLLIGLFTLVVFFAFQTYELTRARVQLGQLRENQNAALADGEKAHNQFDALAGAVAALAQNGDAEAKAIVAEFGRRGYGFRVAPPR